MAQRARAGLHTSVHSPPLPLQWGTHHSKLALILYDDCLRVCVRTFNDLYSDVHGKSQALYVQDFPVRAEKGSCSGGTSCEDAFGTDFEQHLKRYLHHCGGFDPASLDAYDFSSAAVALVASVPGYHMGRKVMDWGHMRLRHLLSMHATALPEEPASSPGGGLGAGAVEEGLICQFSSLGSLTPAWLEEFRATLATTSPSATAPPSAGRHARLPLYLVVPTVLQVRDSVQGWLAGVSVPIRKANLKEWLTPYWRRWGPEAGDTSEPAARAQLAMPHVKSYCRYRQSAGRVVMPWLCVGSHNLSRAAWGEMQKGGSQLCIRSYELSVALFPQRLLTLERDLERPRGRFMRRRSEGCGSAAGPPVLVPMAAWGGLAGAAPAPGEGVQVACPMRVPPAGAPKREDPVWAVDLEPSAYNGLDRFGTRKGERPVNFYGQRRAQVPT